MGYAGRKENPLLLGRDPLTKNKRSGTPMVCGMQHAIDFFYFKLINNLSNNIDFSD